MLRKSTQKILSFLSVVLLVSVVACNPASKYEKAEKDEIDTYLGTNTNINFNLKPSGLYYYEVLKGTGRAPVKYDTAYIKYTGKFLSGNIFDTNVGTANTLKHIVGVDVLISGFSEGISYMAAGGKSIFLIPSILGYGTYGSYPYISGYTPLVFEVELVEVRAGTVK
jgi:FKBP-type peptidyl-prolyl cis-trans isomerase